MKIIYNIKFFEPPLGGRGWAQWDVSHQQTVPGTPLGGQGVKQARKGVKVKKKKVLADKRRLKSRRFSQKNFSQIFAEENRRVAQRRNCMTFFQRTPFCAFA
jgi:hypothetical protein